MNEWKRCGDVQAREALCKEAEALAEEGIEFGRLPWIPRGN